MTLAADDGVLDYSCDCPVGSDGAFCKHCVAAALAWLNRAARTGEAGGPWQSQGSHAGRCREDSSGRRQRHAGADGARLGERRRPAPRTAHSLRCPAFGPDTGAAAVRRAFEKAVRVRDFVPYREATGWARGVDDAIDSIEQLLNDGQAASSDRAMRIGPAVLAGRHPGGR